MDVRTLIKRELTAAPPYHRGHMAANRAGLQVVRAASKHLAWSLRRASSGDATSEALMRDGVATIPEFLAPDEFARVRVEYEASRSIVPYAVEGDRAVAATPEQLRTGIDPTDWAVLQYVNVAQHAEAFPHVMRFANDSRIASAVTAAGRRPMRRPVQVYIHAWQRASEPVDRTDVPVRGEYVLHADTHYPTFKAWLYLCDIDEGNGAFVYAPGSHRLTSARLRYEYEASMAVARARRDRTRGKIPYELIRADRGSFVSSLRLRTLAAPANTLVIADTSGFHRRGDFMTDRPRESIEVSFRAAESFTNRFPGPTQALVERLR